MSKVIQDRDGIAALVQRLAQQMQGTRPILLLPIMTGAFPFCADLLRVLRIAGQC